MNAVHFAAEVGDCETLSVLLDMGISGSVASRFPSSEDVESAAAKLRIRPKHKL